MDMPQTENDRTEATRGAQKNGTKIAADPIGGA
jgi:hypothetical protein